MVALTWTSDSDFGISLGRPCASAVIFEHLRVFHADNVIVLCVGRVFDTCDKDNPRNPVVVMAISWCSALVGSYE